MEPKAELLTRRDLRWLSFVAGIALASLLMYAGRELAAATPVLSVPLRGIFRPPSLQIDNRMLAAGVAETITVPTFAGQETAQAGGIFSASCGNWWYRVTGVAAVPSVDVTDGNGSGRSPVPLLLAQGSTLSVVSDVSCSLSIEWYPVVIQ